MSDKYFELASLNTYLQTALPEVGTITSVEKFSGGQSNPTFKLTTDKGHFVLRSKPPGKLLKSAHAVDREYRVLKSLENTDVPVPRALHLCEDDSVTGSMFYIMSFVEGRIFWDPTVPKVTSEQRTAIYHQMNQVLAAIHNVDLDAVGLGDYGPTGNYYERQFSRWSKQYRASETETIDEMETLLRWLESNMIEDDGRVSLVHGDYRIDNLFFAPGSDNIVAVMDWELSTLGHPFADLAYQCMLWRWKDNPILKGLGDADLPGLGIPTEEEYIRQYCERMGIDSIPNWNFHIAFGAFRLAAITQGVLKRALDGNASSKQAMLVGSLTRPLAQLGVDATNRN